MVWIVCITVILDIACLFGIYALINGAANIVFPRHEVDKENEATEA